MIRQGDFIGIKQTAFCDNKDYTILKSFIYPSENMPDKRNARIKCKKYCGSIKNCWGCNLHCENTCQWIAHTRCNPNEASKTLETEISIKPG